MRAVSAAALMEAWEDGLDEPVVDRAPALLRAIGCDDGRDPAAMTVGTCDLQLFELRQSLFGPDLDVMTTCPACNQDVELAIPIQALIPARPGHPTGRAILEVGRLVVRSRLPTNGDLRAIAVHGYEATATDLLERCVEAIEGPGAPKGVADLPDDVAHDLVAALAARDPGAEITADIACPCGAEWTEIVDIRSILWTELTRWAQARMIEVHQLASAYGWAEREILEMSPYRRRFYLEACAG